MVVQTRNSPGVMLAVFGLGYVLGTVIHDRPLRSARRAATRVRTGASTVGRSVVRFVPWAHGTDDRLVDVREVARVMTPVRETIGPKTPLRDAESTMRHLGVDELVVFKKRRVRGLVTGSDIAAALDAGADPATERVVDRMRSGVDTIERTATVQEALDLVASKPVSRLVVVDEEGRPVGLVGEPELASSGVRSLVTDLAT